jgi:hypothetical protein
MNPHRPAPPTRLTVAVWPAPCEGIAVIPVIEGPYRAAAAPARWTGGRHARSWGRPEGELR